jgi:predicted phosphodiesterase
MKNIIITDMHGEDPSELVIREQRESGIERAIFLGDYDTPKIFEKVRKLKIPKILVAGNHDLHYIYGLEIGAPYMTQSWQGYVKEWDKFPRQKEFMEKLILGKVPNAGVIVETKSGKRNVVYCHASIVDSGSPDSDAPGYVWQRMHSEENMLLNFLKMMEKNYWVMFRGHDHYSMVSSLRKNPARIETPIKEKLRLAKNRLHIVTVGPFLNGDYALFDDKSGYLEFKNTGDGKRLEGI